MTSIKGKTGPFKSGGRVVVAGGGPAGAFFAVVLLRKAKQARQNIHVTIIDKQSAEPRFPKKTMHGPVCEAVIWPGAHRRLIDNGIYLPDDRICRDIEHVWIHGCWKNFPFKVPPHQRLYTLHRHSPNIGDRDRPLEFKTLLLQTALSRGAVLKTGEVRRIRYGADGKPVLTVRVTPGHSFETTADFTVIATGVGDVRGESPCAQPLFRSYQQIHPGFSPAKVRRVLIFDLQTGRDYLQKYMNRELFLILSGCRKPLLDEIALIPRWDCPHTDRIALIGDALGASAGRDGLDAALITAEALAEALVEPGPDCPHISKEYAHVVQSPALDSFYDRLLYGLLRPALRHPLSARVLYQARLPRK